MPSPLLKFIFSNCRGNVLFSIMLISTLSLFTMSAVLKLARNYHQTHSDFKKSTEQVQEHSFDLLLLSERFRIKGKLPPVWYPQKYPSEKEMREERKPVIQVIQSYTGDKAIMAPIISRGSRLLHYTADISRMASLLIVSDLELDKSGYSKNYQTAYLATASMNGLSAVNSNQFMRAPGSSWPVSIQNRDLLEALSNSKVTFIRYVPDLEHPELVKAILVNISSISGGRNISTEANISLDVPPTPSCVIKLSKGQSFPIEPGKQIKVSVAADSLTKSVRLTSDNFATSQAIPVLNNQSIANLGKFRNITNEVTLTVPTTFFPKDVSGNGSWTIKALTSGIAGKSEECSLDVSVAPSEILKSNIYLTFEDDGGDDWDDASITISSLDKGLLLSDRTIISARDSNSITLNYRMWNSRCGHQWTTTVLDSNGKFYTPSVVYNNRDGENRTITMSRGQQIVVSNTVLYCSWGEYNGNKTHKQWACFADAAFRLCAHPVL